MATLTAKERKKIPDTKFALEKERKYPIENKVHAINAKSRATQQYNKGNLTMSQKATIDKKANKVINKK